MEQWLDQLFGPLDDTCTMDFGESTIMFPPAEEVALLEAPNDPPTIAEQYPSVASTPPEIAPSVHTSTVVQRNTPNDHPQNLAKKRYVTSEM